MIGRDPADTRAALKMRTFRALFSLKISQPGKGLILLIYFLKSLAQNNHPYLTHKKESKSKYGIYE